MKQMSKLIAIGCDAQTSLLDKILQKITDLKHKPIIVSPSHNTILPWAKVGYRVAQKISSGEVHEGIICCWTGTGVSIAANKVPGVRAALCLDAENTRGARQWNNANVLALSQRLTSESVLDEILDAWFSTEYMGDERESISFLTEIENINFNLK